ncbi:MAG: acyltransferase [Bacteroidales bacterium]
MKRLEERIFNISDAGEFNNLALEIFRLQATKNAVYAQYLSHLGIDHSGINHVDNIPFLPIELFRTHKIITGKTEPEVVFHSSGTSGQDTGKHYLASESLYRESFLRTFTKFYGNPKELCILALLPSYMERGNSSLVFMMDHLIRMSCHEESGFYLRNYEELARVLDRRTIDYYPTLLLGVSFGLLDLAEKHPMTMTENIKVMETGGMKGKRKELVREELHGLLKKGFGVSVIHSEYGMTELLSQAYAKKPGCYFTPPWMRVRVRDLYDPLTILPPGQAGGINIIDLANIYSCSFIATGDMGRMNENGSFDITGRFDQAEVRGCNLMVI